MSSVSAFSIHGVLSALCFRVYITEDLVRGKQFLAFFIFNPTKINPQDVAQQNEQEFVVGEILAIISGDLTAAHV